MPHFEPDPATGYARGTILKDDQHEQRNSRHSYTVIQEHLASGRRGLYDFIGLRDNCEVPDDLAADNVRTERYLTELALQPELEQAVKDHLGGGGDYRSTVFSRGSAGNITAIAALAEGTPDPIPFFVTDMGGHPSMARGTEVVGADHTNITDHDSLDDYLRESNPSVVAICPSYRDIMDEPTLARAIEIAHAHDVPVFVDDASGSRLRTILHGQRQAIDLGADVVITSTDKYGFDGPRCGVVRGRHNLMDYIETKQAVYGTEARPGTIAAVVRTMEAFDADSVAQWFQARTARAERITNRLQTDVSDRFHPGKVGAIKMTAEDVYREAVTHADKPSPLKPIDASVGLSMLLLRNHGWITVATMGKPGSTVDLRLSLLSDDTERLTDDEIVDTISTEFEGLSEYIANRDRMEALLLG